MHPYIYGIMLHRSLFIPGCSEFFANKISVVTLRHSYITVSELSPPPHAFQAVEVANAMHSLFV